MRSTHTGLFTDFYELAMAQAYFFEGKAEEEAVFDYFFRKNPFENGYVLFSGIQELLYTLKQFSFGKEDIDYLRSQGFREPFLQYLSAFTFRGTIRAPVEGEIVFPVEPLLVVKGGVLELQVIETVLLNVLNFSSLISTKASRIRNVTGDRPFSDFGLRRAQGSGGVMASRAAIIGGASSTSNVLAGYHYQLPIGVLWHTPGFRHSTRSWRHSAPLPGSIPTVARCWQIPDNTLESGVPNAIIVAKEMQEQGHQLKAIRLDSGDLAYFSKKARAMLDAEGLKDVKIVVSNQLDEYVIRSLTLQQAPIDSFGIGTKLITGRDTGALDGVYKLSKYKGEPRMKVSDNIEKTTLPGEKQTVRYLHKDGTFFADACTACRAKEYQRNCTSTLYA
ncbi:MAG: nicotinate phosphoribosyltransferase [Bacteroidales bacterium]|nr:nicotinate phosphoribosyltransferase [Bacteroidales bacterium]